MCPVVDRGVQLMHPMEEILVAARRFIRGYAMNVNSVVDLLGGRAGEFARYHVDFYVGAFGERP